VDLSDAERVRLSAQETLTKGNTGLVYRQKIKLGFARVLLRHRAGVFDFVTRVLVALGRVALSGRPNVGCIDFRNRRYYYHGPGGLRHYYVDQTRYVGGPTRWARDPTKEWGVATPSEEPLWLVELLLAAVEAETVDRGESDDWTAYRVECDFDRASEMSEQGLALPLYPVPNLARISVKVWLDGEGEIRRECWETRWQRVTLELSEHGRAPEDCFPSKPSIDALIA
jgi:hypothetical protein